MWAKELLFAKLLGDRNQDNDLNVRSGDGASSSEQTDDVFERRNDEDVENYARRIYDHVFGHNIEVALSNEETWKNRTRPKPIYAKDVLPDNQQNGSLENSCCGGDSAAVSAMATLGLKNPQDVWTLADNSRVFFEAFKLFFLKRSKVCLLCCGFYFDKFVILVLPWSYCVFNYLFVQEIGSLCFDKDDQLAVEFVTAAANIRASSFSIPVHSLFEAKGIAGNIVHAVATTNAIVAGLIVIEAIKVLQKDLQNLRLVLAFSDGPSVLLISNV